MEEIPGNAFHFLSPYTRIIEEYIIKPSYNPSSNTAAWPNATSKHLYTVHTAYLLAQIVYSPTEEMLALRAAPALGTLPTSVLKGGGAPLSIKVSVCSLIAAAFISVRFMSESRLYVDY